jgi:hypothetical protein
VSRWFGPRGDCGCCDGPGLCLAARGHFENVQGETISYRSFRPGSQAQLTLSGFPATAFARQVMPYQLIGLDGSWPWREYTWTGLDNLNGTYLMDLPLSESGCIGVQSPMAIYTFNATCQIDRFRYERKNYIGTDCTGATLITQSSFTITIPITVWMGVSLWPGGEFRSAFWDVEMFPTNWCPLQTNLQHFKFFQPGDLDPNADVRQANTVSVTMDADGIDIGISGNIRWTGDSAGNAPCQPLIPDPNLDWVPTREHPSCPVNLQSDLSEITGNVATYQMDLIRA